MGPLDLPGHRGSQPRPGERAEAPRGAAPRAWGRRTCCPGLGPANSRIARDLAPGPARGAASLGAAHRPGLQLRSTAPLVMVPAGDVSHPTVCFPFALSQARQRQFHPRPSEAVVECSLCSEFPFPCDHGNNCACLLKPFSFGVCHTPINARGSTLVWVFSLTKGFRVATRPENAAEI